MNTSNISPQPNIEQVRELLSPYLDNEVTPTERQLVEQTLQSSSELRADLESLRQTVALLKAMPAMSAPRPFTLTAADIPAQATTPQRSWLILPGWLTNLASMAFLLVALILGGLFLFSPMKSGSSPTEMVAYQAEAPKAESAQKVAAAPTSEATKAEAPQENPVQASAAAPTEAVMTARMAADETANPNAPPSAKMGAAPAPAAANEEMTTLSADSSDQPGLMSAESATLQPAPESAPMGMAATEAKSKASEKEAIAEATATMPATIEPTATVSPSPIAPAEPVSSLTVWLITGTLAVLILAGGVISWLKHSGKL